jgi:hypothetical protein
MVSFQKKTVYLDLERKEDKRFSSDQPSKGFTKWEQG